MVVTCSTGEVISDRGKAGIMSSSHVRNSPDPGFPENLRISLCKRSTRFPRILNVGARGIPAFTGLAW